MFYSGRTDRLIWWLCKILPIQILKTSPLLVLQLPAINACCLYCQGYSPICRLSASMHLGCNLLLIVFLYFYIWRLYWCTHVNNWCPFMYICVSNCAGCIFRKQESQSMAQIQNSSLYCTQTEVCMPGQQQVVEHTKIWSTYHTVKHLQTSNGHISHLTLVNDWWGLQDIIQTFKKCKW